MPHLIDRSIRKTGSLSKKRAPRPKIAGVRRPIPLSQFGLMVAIMHFERYKIGIWHYFVRRISLRAYHSREKLAILRRKVTTVSNTCVTNGELVQMRITSCATRQSHRIVGVKPFPNVVDFEDYYGEDDC